MCGIWGISLSTLDLIASLLLFPLLWIYSLHEREIGAVSWSIR